MKAKEMKAIDKLKSVVSSDIVYKIDAILDSPIGGNFLKTINRMEEEGLFDDEKESNHVKLMCRSLHESVINNSYMLIKQETKPSSGADFFTQIMMGVNLKDMFNEPKDEPEDESKPEMLEAVILNRNYAQCGNCQDYHLKDFSGFVKLKHDGKMKHSEEFKVIIDEEDNVLIGYKCPEKDKRFDQRKDQSEIDYLNEATDLMIQKMIDENAVTVSVD